jgi:hypothetical protein
VPKILRREIPRAVLNHLRARILEREITEQELILLARWLDTQPEVPHGPWFKRFPGMIACGEGELLKTFLHLGQVPYGEEVQ